MSVAVVTGGHAFDVPNFHRLFRALSPDVEAYIQSIDDFASSPEDVRDAYDAVVFHIMMMEGPTDEGHPWWGGKPKTALEHLGATPQGIVVLHHAILAYPQWPLWRELTGLANPLFGYHIGLTVTSQVANPSHPITNGLQDWTMVDETYTMDSAGAGNDVLITCDHPQSMKTIAWTRRYRQARVFCYQAGHDNRTWVDPNFREVLRRGICWTTGRG
jgi:hypothetical protein